MENTSWNSCPFAHHLHRCAQLGCKEKFTEFTSLRETHENLTPRSRSSPSSSVESSFSDRMATQSASGSVQSGSNQSREVGGAVANGPRPSGPASDQPPTRQWRLHELLLLIAAKRMEHETSLNHTSRERIKTADQKWREILVVLARDSVTRQSMQTKKRWEKLVTDFKKVYDYQNHVGSGQSDYYEMGSDERKCRKIPVNFAHELFDAMECWMGTHRAINPSPNQVVDSGDVEEELMQEAGQTDIGHTPHATNTNYTEENNVEVNSPLPIPADPMETSAAGLQQRTPPSGAAGLHQRSPPSGMQYTGVKKNRRDKLDEQFKKTTSSFLDFLGKDSERKILEDESSRNWDKEKHDNLVHLEMKKHEEMIRQQSQMTAAMSNAITGISDSIRFFATEVARKK